MIEWEKTEEGSCRSYREVPKGAKIFSVNGKESHGSCEVCGKPILSAENHFYDTDGLDFHKSCWSGE